MGDIMIINNQTKLKIIPWQSLLTNQLCVGVLQAILERYPDNDHVLKVVGEHHTRQLSQKSDDHIDDKVWSIPLLDTYLNPLTTLNHQQRQIHRFFLKKTIHCIKIKNKHFFLISLQM